MKLFARLAEISRTENLPFLVIGGHAVQAYGYARVTRDLDLLIRRIDKDKWLAALAPDTYVVERDTGNFLHLAAKGECPLDFMLVTEATFSPMRIEAKMIDIGQVSLPVPSLEHLFALKFHAMKHRAQGQGFRDVGDILSLAEINKIELRGEKFRQLCEKYGDAKIYERILAIGK